MQELAAERDMAAVMLQSTYRGYKGRGKTHQLEVEEQQFIEDSLHEEFEHEDRAATQVQRVARGKRDRNRGKQKRLAEEDELRREIEAELAESMGSHSSPTIHDQSNNHSFSTIHLPEEEEKYCGETSLGEDNIPPLAAKTTYHIQHTTWTESSGPPDNKSSSHQLASASATATASPAIVTASPTAKPPTRHLWEGTAGAPPTLYSKPGNRIGSDKHQVLTDLQDDDGEGLRILSLTWNLHAKVGERCFTAIAWNPTRSCTGSPCHGTCMQIGWARQPRHFAPPVAVSYLCHR